MAFLTAVRFLTILPLGRPQPSFREMGASLAFFPLVGLFLGLALALLDAGFTYLWPGLVSSAMLIVILMIITGAIHMEGFLDACDGLLGGATRERRLEIMRDERVGAFAVAGGICLLLLKWAALFSLPSQVRFPVIVLFPALSRWSMVLAVSAFPYARMEGLGTAFHRGVTRSGVVVAGVVACGGSFVFGVIGGVVLFVAVSLVAWLLGALSAKMLGGLTGDIYGAMNEVIEAVVLVAAIPLASVGLVWMLPGLIGWLQ